MSDADGSIDRREAIARVVTLLGGVAFVGGTGVLQAAARPRPPLPAGAGVGDFSADDVAFLDEVADTILPETRTPGAKAAKTGAFMALMVTDSYAERDQTIFRDGMHRLDAHCQEVHGVGFQAATPQQRLTLLQEIDREQKAYSDAREARPPHYFRMMKELALLGYFTSEIGCTQAQRYRETPGRYDPCVPYSAGEKAWAGHA